MVEETRESPDPEVTHTELRESGEQPRAQGEGDLRRERRGGGTLGLAVAVVALGIAAYAAYQVYLGMNQLAAQGTEVAQVARSLASTETRVVQLDSALIDVTGGQERLSKRVAGAEEQVAGLRNEIAAQAGTSAQDWILAEAEYLIRLAHQRVLIERETSGAVALLRTADALIRDADIVSAMAVREALADDIARLQAAGSVDTTGIYLELAALARQIDSIPRQPLGYDPAAAEEVAEQEAVPVDAGWRGELSGMMSRAGERLSTLVDFRTGVDRVRPVLPPKEEYYLRQNLRLKLEVAQLALLKGNQAAYADSLGESVAWLDTYFDVNDPSTSAMVNALQRLSAERIERDLPEISASLNAIRTYMANFHEAETRPPAPGLDVRQ